MGDERQALRDALRTGMERADRVISLARGQRVQIEAALGARSFRHFVEMAWRYVDPAPFIPNWHIDLICAEMHEVACRRARELVIAIPPRHAKSLLISVLFPAWVWTWDPTAKFITASYDLKLASRDAVKARTLIKTPWYRERWPAVEIQFDQDNKLYYRNTAGGHRWSCSPASGVTGEGADFLLFDDPHNVAQGESSADREAALSFWFEAMPSRLNNQLSGAKAVIQQRVHERDCAGACIKKGWRHLVLPALYEPDHPQAHPRDPRKEPGEALNVAGYGREALDLLADSFGGWHSYAAAGQLQQRPVPREGGVIRTHMIGLAPAAPDDLSLVRSWDLAATEAKIQKSDPDWTVGVLMGRSRSTKRFYVVDVVKLRAGPAEVERAIRATAERDGKRVRIRLPIDPGAAGKAHYHHLATGVLSGWPVFGERETGDKVSRAMPFAAQVEVGNVSLVDRGWNADYLSVLQMFPNGAHDDDVDATAGALSALTTNTTGLIDFFAQGANSALP
ncbi:phage terminase large subunit [Falsiroseomonas sp. CW058]|uniref:phage terminase large subunit n=1 Tax=Falsiroseomonas sp. CW058 TaxID=3388664 RepID=UPI003D317145